MAGGLWTSLWQLYVRVRIFFHYYWLKLIKGLVAWSTGAPYLEDKFVRKIVVIGDGFAEGFGDRVTFIWGAPGISGRLESHINEDDMRSTKQTWIGINRGQYKSTSDDWLPNKPRDDPNKLTLWERTFGPREENGETTRKKNNKYPGKYADIFIVIVGGMDAILGQHPSDYERTVENIKQIVVAVRAMDKPVFVASLPCKANVSRMQKELIDRRNKLLKEWLKSLNDNKLVLCPDLAAAHYRQSEYYYYDQIHFNAHGYTKMKEELVRELKHVIVQREWRAVREELQHKEQ
jgi:lysophospholipase L1-like esterase